MPKNQKAPYRHADGSNCWTKDCSRSHVNSLNQAVTQQDFNAFIEAKEAEASIPKKDNFNMNTFSTQFVKWYQRNEAKGKFKDIINSFPPLEKINPQSIPPVGFIDAGGDFSFLLVGKGRGSRAEEAYYLQAKNFNDAVGQIINSNDRGDAPADEVNRKRLKKYFSEPVNVDQLRSSSKALNKIWNHPVFKDWNMDSSEIAKINAYGMKVDNEHAHLTQNEKALLLANTLAKRERLGSYNYRAGTDNEEWLETTTQLWAIYKIFDKEASK